MIRIVSRNSDLYQPEWVTEVKATKFRHQNRKVYEYLNFAWPSKQLHNFTILLKISHWSVKFQRIFSAEAKG